MNLQELHQQHRDAQAQLDDVRARLDAKKKEFTDMTDRLFEQWKQENAELLNEHAVVIDYAGKVETALREAIKAAYAADPSKKTVAPGLSVRVRRLNGQRRMAWRWRWTRRHSRRSPTFS